MIEIRKVGDKTISIVDSDSGKKYYGSAIYYATSITGQTVTIRSNDSTQPTFVGEVSNISIDGAVKNSVVDCLVALNSFIGSFTKASTTSSGSGGSGSVSPIAKEQLLWDREVVAFGAGDSTLSIALKVRTVTEVSEELVSGKTVVVSTPTLVPNRETKSKLIVATGETVGTLQLPSNIVWRDGKIPTMEANTIYRIEFDIKEDVVFAKTI